MFFIIISRTARGKDTLAKALINAGLKTEKSYTTREPRSTSENSHYFITESAYENYQKTGQVTLETSYGGKTYFFLKNQLEHCDFLILDVQGMYEITKQMPDTPFTLVYLTADETVAKEYAIKRASDPDKAACIFDSRSCEENQDFSMLETLLNLNESDKDDIQPFPENITIKHVVQNDYKPECIEKAVNVILDIKTVHENMKYITEYVIDHSTDKSDIDEQERIEITFENERNETYNSYISKEVYNSYVLMNPNACQIFMHDLCRNLTSEQLRTLTENPRP